MIIIMMIVVIILMIPTMVNWWFGGVCGLDSDWIPENESGIGILGDYL